jgi:hypothetical protein
VNIRIPSEHPQEQALKTFSMTRGQLRKFWKGVAVSLDAHATKELTPDRQERILWAACNWWVSPSWAFCPGHRDDPIGCHQHDTDVAIRYAKINGLYLDEMNAEAIIRGALMMKTSCPDYLKKHFAIVEERHKALRGRSEMDVYDE